MITDPKSSKVRGVAKLNKKDARSETGLFLLEGPQGLKEAIARPELLVEVFVTAEAQERYEDLISNLDVPVQLVSESVMKVLSDTSTPQGTLAVCRQLDVSLDSVISAKPKLIALLANVRDPGNAGTVLRAADAAGADAVIFSQNSVDLYNTKLVRSTTGSIFHLPVVLGADLASTIASLKQADLQVFAATAGGDLITELDSVELRKPTVWMMGNEAWGFDDETLDLADRQVALPIYGRAESLNLATAASVCFYVTAMAQNS